MEKIKNWRMEEFGQENETAAAMTFDADENEEQLEDEREQEGDMETNERMEDEDDHLLLIPGNEDNKQDPCVEDEAVAMLDTAGEAASEDERGDDTEVATALLVDIGGDGEYKAAEDPAVWMDDDEEDVVWQVRSLVHFGPLLKGN